MHKNATKCNETLSKWYKNKHGASKIMDTLETYQGVAPKHLDRRPPNTGSVASPHPLPLAAEAGQQRREKKKHGHTEPRQQRSKAAPPSAAMAGK
jgi:hypothetical protein